MEMQVELVPGEAGWAAVNSLQVLVYSPEALEAWAGRGVSFAPAEQRVLVREPGGPALSHAALHVRDAEWDGLPVRLGGIGSLMTHPAHRRQGLARMALRRALTTLHDEAQVAFALLFCDEAHAMYFARQGWLGFEGEIIVRQPGGPGPFTTLLPMTLGIRRPAATRGRLDLRGLPW